MAISARLQAAMAQRAKTLAPPMRAAWLQAVKDLRASITNDTKIARLIEMGRIDAIITPEALDTAFTAMRKQVVKSAATGWKSIAKDVTQHNLAFSTASPRVLDAIRVLDANLLKPMSADIRDTVRAAVEAGLRDGKGPLQIARELKGVIPLAPNQAEAVRNFEKALREGDIAKALGYKLRDKRFDTLLKRKADLSEKKIGTIVGAYQRKFEAFHTQTIARTAALNSYRAGADAAARSAVDRGILDPARTVKVWVTVGDDRVRDEHIAMEGETVPMDQAFSNGLMYPSEYSCRCQIDYNLVPMGAEGAAVPDAVVEPPAVPDVVEPPAVAPALDIGTVDAYSAADGSQSSVIADWLYRAGASTPEAFIREHFAGIDASLYRLSRVELGVGERTSVRATLLTLDGRTVAEISRSIDLGRKTVDHSLFRVSAEYQASGIGKDYLARVMDQYRRMGIERVDVHANIDVGGYAWARYGFVPSRSSWGGLYDASVRRLVNVDDKLGVEFLRTLDRNNPVDIRKLAESSWGKQVLLNSDWQGTLQLTDNATMRQWDNYVTKKPAKAKAK